MQPLRHQIGQWRALPVVSGLLALGCVGGGSSRVSPGPDASTSGPEAAVRPTEPPAPAPAPTPDAASPDEGGADAEAPDAPVMTPVSGPCSPPLDLARPFEKLSQTGCMDPAHPTQLAAHVVPYEVNSPLWSDGALKTRGMVLPAGKKIHVKDCARNPAECCVIDNAHYPNCLPPADDGRWVFPVGTVLVKNFLFNDDPRDVTVTKAKLVETRLFVRASDKQWVGYGYRWDEAQTDATLVPDERVKIMFNTGKRTVEWNYPSRQDCLKCHTDYGGSSLGTETAQLNRVLGGLNQIDRLAALGLFETPPAKPYKTPLVAPYAGQAGTPAADVSLEARARSYLHSNCSFCHRPDGPFYQIDFRQDESLLNTNVCDQIPQKGGNDQLRNLFPGDPMRSVIWLRMVAPSGDAGRMPVVGSAVVDPDGTKLISDWIRSVRTCPTPPRGTGP